MRTVEKEGIEAEPRMMRVRNPVTGKNKLVSDMSYQEWYEWKRNQNPKAFDIAEKKIKNESSDKAQFERYREILGKNAPKTFADFQDLKYNDTDKWEYTKGLVGYLRKYPDSDKKFYDVQQTLKQFGIKKGLPLPPKRKQAFILPSGMHDPYHIMHRMAERHITDDEVRGYMDNAKCMFAQWGGKRQFFVSDDGFCVIENSNEQWVFKTAWSNDDFDEESEKILEVLKNVGL